MKTPSSAKQLTIPSIIESTSLTCAKTLFAQIMSIGPNLFFILIALSILKKSVMIFAFLIDFARSEIFSAGSIPINFPN